MILITHIIIALVSLAVAAALLVRPSSSLVRVEIGLTAGTVASGVVLVLQGASLLHLCVSGLVFTAISILAIGVAIRRLQPVRVRARR